MTMRRTRRDTSDVLEHVLDKGISIDAEGCISLLGIDVADFDAHVVVASIDTYLTYSAIAAVSSAVRAPARSGVVVSVTETRRRRRP